MLIRSRRIRWARYVAHMAETRNAFRSLVEKPEGKRTLLELSIDLMVWTRFIWLRTGSSGKLL
jgi:hypothetical protein